MAFSALRSWKDRVEEGGGQQREEGCGMGGDWPGRIGTARGQSPGGHRDVIEARAGHTVLAPGVRE